MCVLKVLRTWKYLAKPIKMEECTPEFSREKQDVWIEKTREYTPQFCREICPYKIVFSHLEEAHKK